DKAAAIINEYGPLLIEEYVMGREFTVMLAADHTKENGVIIYEPVEYIFPKGRTFKTYALKTSELHPECNVKVTDQVLAHQLKEATKKIFKGFGGVGYARLDFRLNGANELFFLEINFTCSVFYTNGYEGSADYILKIGGTGQQDFLNTIINEGLQRHQQLHKKYTMKGNAIAGFGIYACDTIVKGNVIFKGEEKAQRIATKSHIDKNWSAAEQENFKRYAYPLSSEVYLLWDDNPSEWAPQNHSCNPNTAYRGLNVIAIRNIQKNDELTLDYGNFLDHYMQPFQCKCGQPNCRGLIEGITDNSVTLREG
ncbi:MAG: SET domain-containing protein-lysine N-methyltransferase, partial [Ferruginibacter sp.]